MNAMRDNYKSINSSIDGLTRENRDHLKRIEKVETDILSLNNSNTHLSSQVQYIKENYVFKKVYDEQRMQMKEDYQKLFKDNEDSIKKLS